MTDGAVVLFCHIACFCAEGVGDCIVAPYAAVAISGPGAATGPRGKWLVLIGLTDLGFRITHAAFTVSGEVGRCHSFVRR